MKNGLNPRVLTGRSREVGGMLAAVILGLAGWQSAGGAVIDLSQPVSNSVGAITGINWKFDSVNGTTTPDSSASGYTGNLDANGTGGTLPYLTDGVNSPGTSGYLNGLAFTPNPNGNNATRGNSRVYANLAVSNNLAMVDTDFTGGAWLKFDSIQSGVAQTVVIMDRGGLNTLNGTNAGHWAFFLTKNSADNWQVGFQSGDGVANATGYNSGTPQSLNLQDGLWHHLGFTYDYVANGDNVVTFWLDGVTIGTASLSVNITSGATDSTTRRFSVGERATGSFPSVFDGSIDDVFATTGLYDFQPVPEPGVTGLALLAAGGFLVLRRFRRRAQS